jgi:ankyrin repeat protein
MSYKEEKCSDYFGNKLAKLNLVGGHIDLAYDENLQRLVVLSEFLCDKKLTDEELSELTKEVTGQWSDGMGENFSGQYELETGIKLDLRPYQQKLSCEQIDDGLAPPPKTVSKIFKALKDVDKLQKLLKSGESPNQRDKSNATPLQLAIRESLEEAAIMLMDAGADLNALENGKYTNMRMLSVATMTAMDEETRLRIVKALLDRGADVNARDGDEGGSTALRWAVNRRNKRLVELFIERGADVNEQQGDSYTPLSSCRDLEIAQLLLRHGADPLLGPYDMSCSEALEMNSKHTNADPTGEIAKLLLAAEENSKQKALEKAEAGDANWQFRLGKWYRKGGTFPKDEQKAFQFFKQAADQNHAKSLLKVALWYYDGDPPVDKDLQKAVDYLERASALDIPMAKYVLGACYIDGKGVDADQKKGIELCHKAAKQGIAPAYAELGEVYEMGKGVAVDLAEALRLYECAKRHGFEPPRLLEAIKRVKKLVKKK